MLVTRKINVFSVLFGRAHATSNPKTASVTQTRKHNEAIIDDPDKRITISRNEDFYKIHALNTINPLSQLNR